MRVICLDIGEKRIGVAVSDPLDITAQGVETIWVKGMERDVQRVKELCDQYDTTRILCGLPLNMDGSEGFQAQRVKELANRLSELGCADPGARTWWTSWPQPTFCNPFWMRADGWKPPCPEKTIKNAFKVRFGI